MGKFMEFIITNSIYATFAMFIVLLFRLILHRAPKVYSYMLWVVVFFRLVCPVSFISGLSLIPDVSYLKEDTKAVYNHTEDMVINEYSGSALTNEEAADNTMHNSDTTESYTYVPAKANSVNIGKLIFMIWLGGVTLFSSWYILSWHRMRKRICTATIVKGNVYQSDQINTAFVFGLFNPKIYVPCWLDHQQYRYIVSHERMHLHRKDNIIKPLAFVIAIVHWFNPAVWISLWLMCRDMELSCDEAVIEKYGSHIRADYSRMLLNFNTQNSLMLEPAFGENSVTVRIKNTLRYKKPSAVCITASILAVVIVLTACSGNNRLPDTTSSSTVTQSYAGNQVQAASDSFDYFAYRSDNIFMYGRYVRKLEDGTLSDKLEDVTVEGRSADAETVSQLRRLLDLENFEIVGEWYPWKSNYNTGSIQQHQVRIVFNEDEEYFYIDQDGNIQYQCRKLDTDFNRFLLAKYIAIHGDKPNDRYMYWTFKAPNTLYSTVRDVLMQVAD